VSTTYVARYWLVWPVVGVLALLGAIVFCLVVTGPDLSAIVALLVLAVIVVGGAYRPVRRAWRSGGAMVRLNGEGVLLAGRPGTTEPQFVPWQDVRDLVLFDSASAPNAAVHYVGVRTKGGAPGDFKTLRRRLDKAAKETSDPELRSRIEKALKKVAGTSEGVGVAAYVSVRWVWPRRTRLEAALRDLGVSVPIISVQAQGDPGGWLAHRETLERLAAEL
jgi:hypothetical protein